MNLLSSLNAGLLGAANGTASLFIRGTNTRATWYGDFEASTSNSSGADIALDAYGSVEAYVNQLVDVVVKDADGVIVRSYTDGYSSPNVEVISPSFTGTDYVTAVAAVNKPTTLQAIEDLWVTNAGSPDWKVSIGGAATTLTNAFGTLNGLVFNVKNPLYGAVGDGVANDQAAIQAALAAAVAAGGGTVFFPIGTYLTLTAITWDYRVHIVMMPGASLTINSATEKTIKFTSANSSNLKTRFFGLALKASQTNTAACISLEASQKLILSNCDLGVGSNSNGHLIDVTAAQASLEVFDTRLNVSATAKSALNTAATVTYLRFERNTFVAPAAYSSTFIYAAGATGAWSGWFIGNVFDGTTNATIGGVIWVRPGAFGECLFSGNRLTGAFTYALFLEAGSRVTGNYFSGCTNAMDCGGATLYAESNRFSSVTNRYGATPLNTGSYVQVDPYEAQNIGAGTTCTLGANVEITDITGTGTSPTLTFPTGFFPGQRRQTIFHNNSGGTWTPVFSGASSVTSISLPTVTSTSVASASFLWTGSSWLRWDFA